MKNIKYFFEIRLTLALSILFTGVVFAQPVIQVPATCNVVVAGTGVGTVTGLGGKVGDGGIVTMPDPFDITGAGGNFTYIPNSTTLTGWQLLGDLSVQTANVPPAAGVYTSGATSPLNIQSYNKNLRNAENVGSPVVPTPDKIWGRSKGRVKVSYSATCGGSITFDIYKVYAPVADNKNLPIIVGPDCLLPNKIYTFSVDQIASDNAIDAIGFDNYYWSGFPAGSTDTYYSADASSVTFTTGSTVGSYAIKCCYGRSNPWDGNASATPTTCVTKTGGAQPSAPLFTSALPVSSTCLNTGAASFPIILTPISGYTYSLTAPGTTWSVTQNAVGNWTVNTSTPVVDNNPGTLQLSITNGSCQPVIFNYPINRNFVAPSATISGPTCLIAGSTTNAFSIQSNAALNPTTWTLPSGWSITAGSANGTNSAISVTVPSSAIAGTYSIAAKSNSCLGSINLEVYVKPAAPVFTAGTPSCVVRGATSISTIAINPVAGVASTGYSWLPLPSGWTCTTNCNTVNPTFVPNATSGASVTLTATAISGTGCSTSTTKTIYYSPVAPAFAAVTCWNSTYPMPAYIDLPITNFQNFGTYSVTANPALFTGTSSVVGSSIRLNNPVFLNTGSYTLVVKHSNGTCADAVTNYAISTSAAPALSTVTFAGAGGFSDTYDLVLATGETFIAFEVNNVKLVNSGTVNIFVGASGGTLQLAGAPLAAGSTVSAIVSVGGCLKRIYSPTTGTRGNAKQLPSTGEHPTGSMNDIKIYPNPNYGEFFIKVANPGMTASASISDISGKLIGVYILKQGENKIENDKLSAGTYIVTLNLNGNTEFRKIVIK